MRALLPVLLAALAVAATACATGEPPAPAAPPPTPATPEGAPLPVADHDWFFTADGQSARLAYGVAESDDLKLGLDCDRGAGGLEMVAIAEKGAKPEILIESGGETGRFPARSEPSELHDGVFLSAAASTREPVFQRFRRVGWLAQWRDGEREAYAPQAGSAGDIDRFFAFCG